MNDWSIMRISIRRHYLPAVLLLFRVVPAIAIVIRLNHFASVGWHLYGPLSNKMFILLWSGACLANRTQIVIVVCEDESQEIF